MRIISWNINIQNKKFKKGFDFIFKQNPDIICLQEVSNSALDYLKKTKYNFYSVCQSSGKRNKRYKVILTKKNLIGNPENFVTQDFHRKIFWRKISNAIFGFDNELHNGIYLDLPNNIRIINLHLDACSGPVYRIEQFKKALNYFSKDKKTIICGDFNSYGNIFMNSLFKPIFNFPFSHIKVNEKKELAKIFERYNLTDIFKGIITYPFFPKGFQIDHVLIPNNIKLNSRKVFTNKFYSDHRILLADLEI